MPGLHALVLCLIFPFASAHAAYAGSYFEDFDDPNGSCGDDNIAEWTEEFDADVTTQSSNFVSANCALRLTDTNDVEDGIISPIIDLSGATSATLSFEIRGDVNSTAEDIEIGWRVGGSGYNDLENYDDQDGIFKSKSYTLPSGALQSDFQIVFRAESSLEASDVYDIDNVSVTSVSPLEVTNTNDSGTGSLRAAIEHANANASADAITFNIAGAGPHVISVNGFLGPLPTITDDGVSIDGTTQPGASCGNLWAGTPHTLNIRLDSGSGTDPGYNAITTAAADTVIKGLSITRFNTGVQLNPAASDTVIQCSYIGLEPDGTSAGNYGVGIRPYGAGARIGGLTAGEGNVISANENGIFTHAGSTDTAIRGNFIGTDPTGLAARANYARAINNFNGTATWRDITDNLIAGNAGGGIILENDDDVSGSSGDLLIQGNYIGVDRTGNTALANTGSGIFFPEGSASGVTIGGTGAGEGNVLSGNNGFGINLFRVDNIDILGNNIGLGTDGTTALGNNNDGIYLNGADNVNVGDGTAAGRNIISSNTNRGIAINEAAINPTILGNYIGVAADGTTNRGNSGEGIIDFGSVNLRIGNATGGGNLVSGSGTSGMILQGGGAAIVEGNIIGLGADGSTSVPNTNLGILVQNGTTLTLGGTTPVARNVISGNGSYQVAIVNATSGQVLDNYIGLNSAGTAVAGGGSFGLFVQDSTGVSVGNGSASGRPVMAGSSVCNFYAASSGPATSATLDNIYAGLLPDGTTSVGGSFASVCAEVATTAVTLTSSRVSGGGIGIYVNENTKVAVTDTEIFGNTGPGIDINFDGVTVNDAGDGDSGANDVLNFPVINGFSAEGTTSVGYDFNLDVPSHGNGYRIDFFKNTVSEAYGEGEIHLGSVDVSHAGGDLNFTGTLTANTGVSVGDNISATTTRKTSGVTYDITSEFSATVAAISPLVVTNTHDSGTGSLRNAITHANSFTDDDAITFAIPGAGPHTIALASQLPVITDAGVSLDASTQTGATCGSAVDANGALTDRVLKIKLDASALTGANDGLKVEADGVTIKGFVLMDDGDRVGSTDADAIDFNPGGDNGTLLCNHIGVDFDGTTLGLFPDGVETSAVGDAYGLTVGDGTYAGRNVIAATGGFLLNCNDCDVRGNYLGVLPDGVTPAHTGDDAALWITGDGATIGAAGDAARNVIGGGTDGILLGSGASNATILNNHIGIGADGSTVIGGTESGIQSAGASTVTIGDGTAGGRNVIADYAVDGILATASTNLTIDGNYIGVAADGSMARGNGGDGIVLAGLGGHTNALISDNVISANGQGGVDITSGVGGTLGGSSTITLTGNKVGVAADGTTALGNTEYGIKNTNMPGTIVIGGDGAGEGNIIAHNGNDGVRVQSLAGTTMAIIANSIHSNGGLGIDLEGTANVDTNDAGDGDTGPNELLNHPVIDAIGADGTVDITWGVSLDAPAGTYRIDLFLNTGADPSGYGEGETHLGAVDVVHTGGGLESFTGTLTAYAAVSVGDLIAGTATRDTGGSVYDITSEFSLNATAQDPLIVTSTNDTGVGTLRGAIEYANTDTGRIISFDIPGAATDVHTITLASALPQITAMGTVIDGETQGDASCGQLITGTPHDLRLMLDGGGIDEHALDVKAINVTVRGLSIVNIGKRGLRAGSGGDNILAECLYVGMEPDGVTANSVSTTDAGGAVDIDGADGATVRNSLMSGNTALSDNDGLRFDNSATNGTATGNIIGLDETGTLDRGNADRGIVIQGGATSGFTIGGTTAATRNILSGNGTNGIRIWSGASNVTLLGNYIGTDITGLVPLGNDARGISIDSAATNTITIGGTGAGEGNVVAASGNDGIGTSNGPGDITLLGNMIGVGSNGTTALGNGDAGVALNGGATGIVIGDGTAAGANIIAHNVADGVRLNSDSANEVAILANSIHSNGTTVDHLGIDIVDDGVNANDADDTDTGPNDLLNYPVLNGIAADGTVDITYDVTLDVPSDGVGYRIDLFKNTAADASGHGEGEVHLGFFETGAFTAASGGVDFVGDMTANASVSVGDIVSATTTRMTSGVTYDITSEFSASILAADPLIVTSTADDGAGSLRSAIEYANANTGKDDIIFNISGAGPHTITLASNLPNITDDGVSIDGTTQSGASCGDLWGGTPHTLMIRLHGNGATTHGLQSAASTVSFKGLSITNAGAAISSESGSDGITVTCSYLGLAPDGTVSGNDNGVLARYANMTVGGLTAGDGNVISSNNIAVWTQGGSTNTIIRGNFIGTDPTGLIARPNTTRAINNSSGAATWGDITRNLISGNANAGAIVLEYDDVITGASGDVVIAGNYIGVDRTGNAALANSGSGLFFGLGSISGVTIGGTSAADRNVISGNTGDGIDLYNNTDIEILGNYIGVGADGTTAVGNGNRGIQMFGASAITIGNGMTSGRNVIAGNAAQAINAGSTESTIAIAGNHIGTDASGNTALTNGQGLAAGSRDAIVFVDATKTDITINDNVIGGYESSGIEFLDTAGTGIVMHGNRIGLGADGTSDISGTGGFGEAGIHIGATSGGAAAIDITVGGTDPGEGNTIANAAAMGVTIYRRTGVTVLGNTIRDNGSDGVRQEIDSRAAIYANSIYSNGGLGIDLNADGVTANDAGDGDTGPNELLNFPVLNGIGADGTVDISYDFDLDVPSNGQGYRIDFFKNTAADASGHGEGEIHLGSVDVAHAGGDLTFTGSLTANAAVSVGDIISATATRKTSGVTYDITSEFSASIAANNPLAVTTVADNGAGSLRAAITYANANAAADGISFALAGGGPHTITLASALPQITDDGVTIDGTTQSGANCGDLWAGTPHTLTVNVVAPDRGTNVFDVEASDVTIKGLAIQNGSGGIRVGNARDRLTVQCTYIGLDSTGAWIVSGTANDTAFNIGTGVDHLIGGPGAGDGNVLSGNSSNQIFLNGTDNITIQGNFIGTNPAGTAKAASSSAGEGIRLGGGVDGITLDSNLISGLDNLAFAATTGSNITVTNTYWGSDRAGTSVITDVASDHFHMNGPAGGITTITIGTPGNGNLFAGNGRAILMTGATDLVVQGNHIGVGLDGTTDLGQTFNGIFLDDDADGSLIGGTGAGEGNVIAYANSSQIRIDANDVSILGNTMFGDDGPMIDLTADATDALNRPVVEHVAADGTTTLSAQVSADVPAGDYRVELFRVGTANTAEQGDAATYLGAFDITHGGTGAETFRGTIAGAATVSSGDAITATVTEKPTVSTYASTSALADNGDAATAILVLNADDAGGGSLRDALDVANARASIDAIRFDIPGLASDVHTITLASALPALSDDGISIDGTTQGDAVCGQLTTGTPHDLRVALSGNAGAVGVGLEVAGADNAVITGLSLGGFNDHAFTQLSNDTGTRLECLYVGVAPDGVTATPVSISDSSTVAVRFSAGTGVVVDNSLISGNNDDAVDRGLYLFNVAGATVTGNLIGTDETGAAALGNSRIGVSVEGTSSAITIGGTTAETRNVISGNGLYGVYMTEDASGVTLLGNYIGTDITGALDLGNGDDGVHINGADTVQFGNGTPAGRNVISGNANDGVDIGSAASGITLLGNHIGTAADGLSAIGNDNNGLSTNSVTGLTIGDGTAGGRNVISGNGSYGLTVQSTSTLSVTGNYIGTDATGQSALANALYGIRLYSNPGNTAMSGLAFAGNVISGNTQGGVDISSGSTTDLGVTVAATFTGNRIGVAADGTTALGNAHHGIKNTSTPGPITIGGDTSGAYNTIAHNGQGGVRVTGNGGSTVTVLGNTIHSNGGLGIDLDGDGVTLNDSGDGDTGANELLNFPVVTLIIADGTVDIEYDFTLDVPVNSPNGYRVDLFKSTAADGTGYGEGETHLGSIDVSGSGTHTGTKTVNAPVASGEWITATVTRKTSGVTYDITSEFSLAIQATNSDYADAPASYGDPSHRITPGVYLGAGVTSENAAAHSVNADGDADDGVTIPALAIGGSGTITVDAVGAGGYLQAWIDFDGDGSFDDPSEKIADDVQDLDSDGTISLSVTIPPGATTAQTYARFRWSTDFTIGTDGEAPDGEVEDYALTFTSAATTLAGTIILDNGAGGGTAHDGAQSGWEAAATIATVSIFETSGATLLTSATTDGGGGWSATLPFGFSGEIEIVATPASDYLAISEGGVSGLPGLVNPSTVDGRITFTPVQGSATSGITFGLVAEPSLAINREGTVQAGQVVTLDHTYTATSDATVTFAITDIAQTPAGAFSLTLWQDAACDGTLDGVLSAPVSVAAGQSVCISARIQAGSATPRNASLTFGLTASTAFTGTTVTRLHRNDDRVTGTGGGGGNIGGGGDITLEKFVRNITKGTPEGTQNSGGLGDVLEYRIQLSNPTPANATNITVNDQTPAYTTLAAPIITPVTVAPGVNCTLTTPNTPGYAGPIEWTCPGSLPPGAQASLTFQVQIDP